MGLDLGRVGFGVEIRIGKSCGLELGLGRVGLGLRLITPAAVFGSAGGGKNTGSRSIILSTFLCLIFAHFCDHANCAISVKGGKSTQAEKIKLRVTSILVALNMKFFS